ncbi:putative reverse transcriptase domain-containing protein [Tanacetum coccineum]
MDRLARLYLNEIVARHGVLISIISDRDSRFTLRFWQTMQEALRTKLDMSMAYHPQTEAYRFRLIEGLNGVHDTFHVSNLKKCLADPTLQVPVDEIQVDAKLNFVEEPMEIFEREFKKLKWSRISIVKVLRMINEAELQVLADLKSILYGLCSERFDIELCVELKYFEDYCFKTSMDPSVEDVTKLCIRDEASSSLVASILHLIKIYLLIHDHHTFIVNIKPFSYKVDSIELILPGLELGI